MATKKTIEKTDNTPTSAETRKSYAYVAGIYGADGHFLGHRQLDEMGLEVVMSGFGNKDKVAEMRNNIFEKKVGPNRKQPATKSREVQSEDSSLFASTDVIEPPYDFDVLSRLYSSCEVHATCINTKAGDVAYNGWELVLSDEMEGIEIDPEVLLFAKKEVLRFLRKCADRKLPVDDLVKSISVDLEKYGTAGFEVIRDHRGFISYLNHIPMNTMKVLSSIIADDPQKPSTFMQVKNNKEVYFVPFGFNVQYKEEFDPETASADEFPDFEDRDSWVEWNVENVVSPTQRDENAETIEGAASEFYLIARPPKSESTIFGEAAAVSAFSSMLADMRAEQYNLNFFTSGGVPYYAIVFKNMTPQSPGQGGESGDFQAEAALEAYLQEFFAKHLKGQARGTLILQLFGDAEVEFVRLSPESLEASFIEYRDKAADRIRMAHEVPPAALGIEQTNNLGTNSTRTQLTRYRDHIVSPGQRFMEYIFNNMIRCGLLIPFFDLRFKQMPVEDETERREFKLKEYEVGVITPNEVREETGRQPFTSPVEGEDIADGLIIRNAQIAVVRRSGAVETTMPGDSLDSGRGGTLVIPNTSGGSTGTEEKENEDK